jgi:hypothetical protein
MLQEVCTEHMKERINCWCVTCFSWTWNLLSCCWILWFCQCII